MKQKRIYIISIFAALLLTISYSCKDTGPVNYQNAVISLKPQSLSLSKQDVWFHSLKASTTIQVKSTNVEWEITGIPDWITIKPTSGSGNETVTVTVTENVQTSNRVGIISFKSKDDSWSLAKTISISQNRAAFYATPETERMEFDGSAGTLRIKVSSNTDDWNVKAGASMNWCTVTKDDGYINLSVSPNTGSSSRTGQIEISTADGTEYVIIVQRPSNISSTMERLDFPVSGGTKTIDIRSEAPWTVVTSYYWINVTPSSGLAGNSTVSVEVVANNSMAIRSGYIYIVSDDSEKDLLEIPVSQEAIAFSVDKTSFVVPASGSVETVDVKSNSSWAVAQDIPSWIQVEPKTGTGDCKVKVTVSKNTDLEDRSAILNISPQDIDYPTALDISQRGLLSADSMSMEFSDKPSSLYLTIYTDLDWTALASDPWISLDKESGTGSAQLTVSVTENTADTIRTGYVAFMAEGRQMRVTVLQQGKYLNVSSSALHFTSKGGSSQISLKTNDKWTATVSDDWITLSAKEGSEDCNLIISAADHPSATARNGYVDIIPQGSNPVRIAVNQTARYLKLSTDQLDFFSTGGTSDPITIYTDGTVVITTPDDWITVNHWSNTLFIVTTTRNEGSSRSGTVKISLSDLTEGTMSMSIKIKQKGKDLFEASGYENGYGYVDLGLSVKWASFNVGAGKPEDYGNYYAWGEPVTKTDYSWYTYMYCKGSGNTNTLTQYCNSSSYGYNGFTDKDTTLLPEDDVAHVAWGGSWRMPTQADFNELLNNCDWSWVTQNGVKGWKITSSKDSSCSIFLPAAGYRNYTFLYNVGSDGYYWSSSLRTDYPLSAWYLYFNSGTHDTNKYSRNFGFTVRPVCP